MTATQTAFQALFANFAGNTVIATDTGGGQTEFKVAHLDTKVGTMKNGDTAEYVVLQRADDQAVVISLHPNTAKKLFSKGEEGVYKIKAAEPEVVDQPETETKAPSKKDRAVAIYNSVVAAGGARKQAVAQFMSELGLSAPGASTYYQNCKHLWK